MRPRPEFLILTREDCNSVIARNHVGRIAFVRRGVVEIQPIAYVCDGDWIFLRSAWGTKVESLRHNPFVAFEVDEIAGPFDWRSVVAHGTVYMLPEDGAPIERQQFERAVAAIRGAAPSALTSDDPTPQREIVYGLHVDRLDGRMARGQPSSDARDRQPERAAPTGIRPRDTF